MSISLIVSSRWLGPLLGLAGMAGSFVASMAWAGQIEDRFTPPAADAAGAAFDHGAWTVLLQRYVRPGADGLNRVDYAAFKSGGQGELKAYLAALQVADVARLSRAEQFAFWANLYNAKTVDVVLDAYPVASIKDIRLGGGLKSLVGGGPWQAQVLRVGGLALSLDDIENKILRPLFGDPRAHYAINCASVGCPNLMPRALAGAGLEGQLDDAARAYIASPRGLIVKDGRATASSIYNWFQADFGGSVEGVLAHLRRYAPPEQLARLKRLTTIDGFDYDWRLNDVAR